MCVDGLCVMGEECKRWADLCAVNKVEQDARIYMCISLHDIVHNPAVILKY